MIDESVSGQAGGRNSLRTHQAADDSAAKVENLNKNAGCIRRGVIAEIPGFDCGDRGRSSVGNNLTHRTAVVCAAGICRSAVGSPESVVERSCQVIEKRDLRVGGGDDAKRRDDQTKFLQIYLPELRL